MNLSKPRVFIGSSRELMNYVDAIQGRLSYHAEVTPWHAGVFKTQYYPMEDLGKQLDNNDFAVFVFGPDDIIFTRGKKYFITRDNTLFEMGLFWGKLRRERVFFLVPSEVPNVDGQEVSQYHLASDLTGLTVLEYEANRTDGNLHAAVNTACSEINNFILQLKHFEHPEKTIPVLRSVLTFFSGFSNNIITRQDGHFEPLVDAIRNAYNANCIGFSVRGAALWQGDSNEIKQVAGNVGRNRAYPIGINKKAKTGQPRVLVVDSYLNSRVEFIEMGRGVVKEYLLCYPLSKDHVISIHINGHTSIESKHLEVLYSSNEALIGTINTMFGGEWS